MCDLQLLGGEGACRYYLSMITNSDQFALWHDEFLENVQEFIIKQTNGAASRFSFDLNSVGLMAPFLKREFDNGQSNGNSKTTKQDRAVELLLRHPFWSDEQIAESVPTTVKQLQRFTNYNALKASRSRKNATEQADAPKSRLVRVLKMEDR